MIANIRCSSFKFIHVFSFYAELQRGIQRPDIECRDFISIGHTKEAIKKVYSPDDLYKNKGDIYCAGDRRGYKYN